MSTQLSIAVIAGLASIMLLLPQAMNAQTQTTPSFGCNTIVPHPTTLTLYLNSLNQTVVTLTNACTGSPVQHALITYLGNGYAINTGNITSFTNSNGMVTGPSGCGRPVNGTEGFAFYGGNMTYQPAISNMHSCTGFN